MAYVEQTPPKQNIYSEEALGLFPSPIVNEHFDPYTDPLDRMVYVEAEGNTLRILGFAQLERMHDLKAGYQNNPDHDAVVSEIRRSMEDVKGMRVKRPSWPPEQ